MSFLRLLFKREIKLYDVNENAYKYYIKNVRKNINDDLNLVQKKLTRNIMCGKKVNRVGKIVTYMYGCLMIKVNRIDHKIVWIKNYHWSNCKFRINKRKKQRLSLRLGI